MLLAGKALAVGTDGFPINPKNKLLFLSLIGLHFVLMPLLYRLRERNISKILVAQLGKK